MFRSALYIHKSRIVPRGLPCRVATQATLTPTNVPESLAHSEGTLQVWPKRLPTKKLSPHTKSREPWHIFTPSGLAAVNTIGNICALVAAASVDHIQLRAFAGCASTMVVAFNFLMPKPLQQHQWTAGGWGIAFAVLHFANLARLLYQQTPGVHLTDEEEDIYEHGFQKFGVTPRQFSNMMSAGASFVEYKPDAMMTEQGKPVDRVMFVVWGKCIARHAPEEVMAIEYNQDVFIGEVEPRVWRAEYLGQAVARSTVKEEEDDSWEDEWLIEQASSVARRSRGRTSRGMREMLSDGLAKKVGKRTMLMVGSAWENETRAGPQGCRVISWPLGSFVCAVGKDAQLCEALEKVDEFGLASKIGAGRGSHALEGYKEILDAVISDGRVGPEEKHALHRYRARHGIPHLEHLRMLKEIGWTESEFEDGIKNSNWYSIGKLWRSHHPAKCPACN